MNLSFAVWVGWPFPIVLWVRERNGALPKNISKAQVGKQSAKQTDVTEWVKN